jgi:hypothetical protein
MKTLEQIERELVEVKKIELALGLMSILTGALLEIERLELLKETPREEAVKLGVVQ